MTNILLFLILVALVAPALLMAVTDRLLIAGCTVIYWSFRGLLIAAGVGLTWTLIMAAIDRPQEAGTAIAAIMLVVAGSAVYVADAFHWLRRRFKGGLSV
jgi:hypothetical protein